MGRWIDSLTEGQMDRQMQMHRYMDSDTGRDACA